MPFLRLFTHLSLRKVNMNELLFLPFNLLLMLAVKKYKVKKKKNFLSLLPLNLYPPRRFGSGLL